MSGEDITEGELHVTGGGIPPGALQPHEDLKRLERLFPWIEKFQALATKHGIRDIFQDNGGKILQIMLVTGFKALNRREGNDALDAEGREIELKTVNILLQRTFTTHHHMNLVIIEKYRKVDWYFAVYEGIILREIFHVTPNQLEPFYLKWEASLRDGSRTHINNPKVPVKFVRKNGKLVYRAPD